jgi:hypothetical protein
VNAAPNNNKNIHASSEHHHRVDMSRSSRVLGKSGVNTLQRCVQSSRYGNVGMLRKSAIYHPQNHLSVQYQSISVVVKGR